MKAEKKQEDIIIYGAGKNLNLVIKEIEKDDFFQTKEIWDNDCKKWGKANIRNQPVNIVAPHELEKEIIIIISSSLYEYEIKDMLISKYNIASSLLKNINYCLRYTKKQIIQKYQSSTDKEIQAICNYLLKNDLQMLNGTWTKKYTSDKCTFNIFLDEETKLLFSYWKGKKIYMHRGIKKKENARALLMTLAKEQDRLSPHCYTHEGYRVETGDVIVDCGAAEGFFSLENIDIAKKVYIIEGDPQWLEALSYTFAPYKYKVELIPKWVGKQNNAEFISIDEINQKEKVTYLKMDIEGGEIEAIEGAEETLKRNDKMKAIICTYHKTQDADILDKKFAHMKFERKFVSGYVYLPFDETSNLELRHGVLLAKKE